MLETPLKAMTEPKHADAPPTFAACAARYIELRRPTWASPRQAVQWESSLARHIHPQIGDKSVDQVTRADIMAILRPMWTARPALSRKLRQRTEAVLEWATIQQS